MALQSIEMTAKSSGPQSFELIVFAGALIALLDCWLIIEASCQQ